MAGKNQVTLTFAGDSKSLERTFSSVQAGGKETEASFDKLGDSSQQMSDRVRSVGTSVDHVGDRTRRGSKDTEHYASRLDRAGEAGGNAESQFLGLGAGISGTSTLMRGGSLSAEEMAMAVADIGDSVEHTVVPWLAKGRDAAAGFIDKIGGIKGLVVGGALVAGVAALGFAIKEMDDAANTRNLDEMADKLQASSFATSDVNRATVSAAASMGKLDEAFERALEAGPRQAEQFIELAAASGVSSEKLGEYRDRLDTSTEASEQATIAAEEHSKALETEADRIRGVNDARQAALDPVFAMIDAVARHDEAQRAVLETSAAYDEAVKNHGDRSAEAAEALRAMNDAQVNAASSAADVESAASDLEAQIAEHPATLSNAKLALERWVAAGLISEEQARQMAVRFQAAANSADDIQGARTATLNARDNASPKVINTGNRLTELDGRTATVHIEATAASVIGRYLASIGAATGGIVPQYMAAGGIGRPRGTDTIPAMLTPGEMVLNKMQQAELWAIANGGGRSGGGGPHVTVIVQGSVFDGGREIRRVLRDELQRGGFAGLIP